MQPEEEFPPGEAAAKNCSSSVSVSVSVLLFCGLPGAGKSTLASSVVKHYSSNEEQTRTFHNVKHIEYDSIESNLSQQYHHQHDENGTGDRGEDSDSRANIGEGDDAFSDQDLKAWRETRKVALHQLEQELSFSASSAHGDGDPFYRRRTLIIMDDNFHLRSMRRDVYKTCQTFIADFDSTANREDHDTLSISMDVNIGLTIIYVNTPLEECVANNEKRLGTGSYVPPRIIHAMNDILEPPDNGKANFEACIINTMEWNLEDELSSSPNHNNKGFYENLTKCLFHSVSMNPIQPPPPTKSLEQLEQERLATLKSRLHQMDLILRSLVGTTCRTNKKYAKVANEARKRLLQECKEDTCNYLDVYDDNRWIAQRFSDLVLQDCSETDDCDTIRLAIDDTLKGL